MTTEWMALWIHFLWSGVLTMVFSTVAWREIGFVTRGMDLRASDGGNEAVKQRRRLLRIAVMVTVCLLFMVSALLSTSLTLDEWSRTADISLACEKDEIWSSRNWAAYGFNEGDAAAVNACSYEERGIDVNSLYPCLSGCFWNPAISVDFLVCDNSQGTLEEWVQGNAHQPCDCPCASLITVEQPSVVIFGLAHVAQSLVLVIVGLNLGFRPENLVLWKRFAWKMAPSWLRSTSIEPHGVPKSENLESNVSRDYE